jgi:hypothetical protein
MEIPNFWKVKDKISIYTLHTCTQKGLEGHRNCSQQNCSVKDGNKNKNFHSLFHTATICTHCFLNLRWQQKNK